MNKEQRQVQQAFLDSEKEVLNNLKKNYQDALDEINNKIEILMARQDADMQHVIYQIEYQKALKTQVQSILEQLQTNNFETVSEYLTNCYEDGFIGTMYDLQGQGIPLVMPMDQEQIVAAIQHKTKLSEDLYTSLGKDIKDLQKKISSEISRGISTGQMFSEISRNIAVYAGISRNNAMRIARTEGHRIQIQATMNAQNKAKEKGADIVKQWDSTLDGKTRPHHRMLDGQIRELDEPFEVDGKEVEAPGMFGRPSEDCNCRCALLQRARWALDEAELETLKQRAAYFGLDKSKEFDDYKDKYLKISEEDIEKADSVMKSFVPATTIEEAKDALSNKVGFRNIDDSIDSMDKQLLIDNTNQLMRLENKFYAIHKSEFVDIDLDKGKFNGGVTSHRTSPTNQYLTLNEKYYSDRNSLIAKEIKGVKSNFSMPFSLTDEEASIATVTHEYGHVLQNTIKKDYMESLGWNQSDIFAFVNREAKTDKAKYKWYSDVQKKVQDDCYDEIIAIAKKNNPSFDLDANISDYGKESKGEFFAEVFMNSQLSEPNELGIAMNEWLEKKGLVKQ